MITLDTNLYLLCSLFNINSSKLSNDYTGMSVEEIMEAEAAQGNAAAANYAQIIGDPAKLIQLFQLNDPGNKLAILSNMNEEDLEDLLPYLDNKDLVAGLNYFTKDKLLVMINEMPKEQLINYTLQMFSVEHLMALMPQEQLDKVLTSPEMDKDLEMKCLQSLKPEILIQMYEAATGKPITTLLNQDINSAAQQGNGGAPMGQNALQPVVAEIGMSGNLKNIDVNNLLNQIAALPDDKFREAMISIPPANKQFLVLQMTKENPNIMLMFDSEAYTNILAQKKDKNDLIRYATTIENEQLVGMIQQLPKDLTSVVLTQIDTNIFADKLIANFKNVLSEIVAA